MKKIANLTFTESFGDDHYANFSSFECSNDDMISILPGIFSEKKLGEIKTIHSLTLCKNYKPYNIDYEVKLHFRDVEIPAIVYCRHRRRFILAKILLDARFMDRNGLRISQSCETTDYIYYVYECFDPHEDLYGPLYCRMKTNDLMRSTPLEIQDFLQNKINHYYHQEDQSTQFSNIVAFAWQFENDSRTSMPFITNLKEMVKYLNNTKI
jgi:hypothetical protein